MNTGIEKVAQWMIERTKKENENNPRANKGFVGLKFADYEDKMILYVFTALQVLVQRFASDKRDTPVGHAKLTEVSMAIGKLVSDLYPGKEGEFSSYYLLPLGDAFIGAFLTNGYIEITRDQQEDSEYQNSSAPYILSATEAFNDLQEIPEVIHKDILRATTDVRIPNVKRMIQGHGRGVIKGHTDEHQEDLKTSIEEDRKWIQALNHMQQTGWQINEEVFNVIDREYDSMILPVPKRPGVGSPEKVEKAFKRLKEKDTPLRRKKYNDEMELWNIELESLRAASKNVETRMIYSKAREMKNLGTCYQFVELDYRGRAYYQEPFMNYQGTDMARGLLQFSEGKEIGPIGGNGCKWLAIHTACSYNQSYSINEIPEWCTYDYKSMLQEQGLEDISVDKMTLKDRAQWTYENMDKILQDTNDIKDCEKPIVYLACCIEWKNYLGNPHGHISYLPIPIDGSCNGYQHSGAIAKDEITGGLVSLVDQEVQSDLYLRVAQAIVKKNPKFFNARPKMKMKHIRKGIVKRGVMTRAYSAGSDTIAENMYKDCHMYGYTKEFNITMLDCVDLAQDVYDLISDECPGATKTMKYLQELTTFQLGEWKTHVNGKEISISDKKKRHAALQKAKKTRDINLIDAAAKKVKEMKSVCVYGNGSKWLEWVTPSGFQVRYHVYYTKTLKIKSTIPGYTGGATSKPGRITHVLQEESNIPDSRAFQAGISPNFIHSMDAAHMGLVIQEWSGPFGAVHDSYSALACDVEELSRVTREKFIDIYDVDDSYGMIEKMILDGDAVCDISKPTVGKLEVSKIKDARYFFS